MTTTAITIAADTCNPFEIDVLQLAGKRGKWDEVRLHHAEYNKLRNAGTDQSAGQGQHHQHARIKQPAQLPATAITAICEQRSKPPRTDRFQTVSSHNRVS